MSISLRRPVALLGGSLIASLLVVLGTATTAQACDLVTGPDGVQYCNGVVVPGTNPPTGTPSGPPKPPPCTFTGIWDQFCRNTAPCYMNDPANIDGVDLARAIRGGTISSKPNPEDRLIFVSCKPPGGERVDEYYWSSEIEDGVTVRDRLLAAYGQLQLPTITPVFNPPARTLVNLDTWWWADGAPPGAIVGSEALGLVAIAEPTGMKVTAAGQTISCPLVTTRSDECRMVFRRSGTYTAVMNVDYRVRFELGGQPFAVPGGNEDLLSLSTTDEVQVPVVEVQSLVTKTR